MGSASRRVVILVVVGVLAVGVGEMAATGAAAGVPRSGSGQASAAVTLSSNPVLFAVSAVSGSDAWAVGRQNSSGVFETLILHWNGTAWSKVNSPSPSLSDAELYGVSAVSGSDAWAVGSFWNRSGTATETLILHWDGTAWTQVKSPNPSSDPPYTPSNSLFGVSARSGSDAWAVGSYGHNGVSDALVLHWDGTAWTQVKTPTAPQYTDFGLTGVSAVSGSDAWAVGGHSIPSDGGKSGTLIMHWDGTAWSTVDSPNPGSGTNSLAGVSATSGSDAWAVVDYSSYDTPGRSRTLVLHWDGTAWSTVNSPTPNPYDLNSLQGVNAHSVSDAWAVGVYWNTTGLSRSLILHWDGTGWSMVNSPNPGLGANRLAGVSARSGSDAWAVGDHDTAVSTTNSLIAHWNGTLWANAIPRYWLTTSKGNVYNFGDAAWFGSTAGKTLPAPVVSMAATPDGQGYWLTTSKGNVYNFGGAAWFGSTAGKILHAPVVAMAASPDGQGYWLTTSKGNIYNFGGAAWYGSTAGKNLPAPVVDIDGAN